MKKKRLQRSDVLWMTSVAVLILLQFWWLPGNPTTPDDTYSKTLEGKRGFFQTLETLSDAGLLPAVRRETNRLIPPQSSTLVIVSPDRYPNQNEQNDLGQFVLNGGTLLFAPNWTSGDCSLPRLQIETVETNFNDPIASTTLVSAKQDSSAPSDTGTLTAEAEASGATPDDAEADKSQQISATPSDGMDVTPDLSADSVDLTTAQEIQARTSLVSGLLTLRTRAVLADTQLARTVLVTAGDSEIQAASWPFGRGRVVVCASPDIFSNASMLDPVRAELAVRLVEHAHVHHQRSPSTIAPEIVVSEFLNTSDKYHGAAVLVSPTLRSGTLQLILVAFLAGWYGFHRFGPVQRTTAKERRSLTESAESVGNLHFRTASGSESVSAYLDYVSVQLQKMLGPAGRLDNVKLIAARTGMHVAEISQAIASAQTLANQQQTSSPAAAAAIRSLSEVLNRLIGGRKT